MSDDPVDISMDVYEGKGRKRRWPWILLILALILTAGGFWLRSRLSPERVAADVKQYLEQNYGVKAELGSVELRWPPAVQLADVKVFRPEEPTSVLNFKRLELSAALMPLLAGRVEIDNVLLAGMNLALYRDKDGKLQLPIMLAPAPAGSGEVAVTQPAETKPATKGTTSFILRRIDLSAINLTYRDDTAANKQEFAVKDLQGQLSPDFDAQTVALNLSGQESHTGNFKISGKLDYAQFIGYASASLEKMDWQGLPLPIPADTLPPLASIEASVEMTGEKMAVSLNGQGLFGGLWKIKFTDELPDKNTLLVTLALQKVELNPLLMAARKFPACPSTAPLKNLTGIANLKTAMVVNRTDFSMVPGESQLEIPDLGLELESGQTQELKDVVVKLVPESAGLATLTADVRKVDLAGVFPLAKPWLPAAAKEQLTELQGRASISGRVSLNKLVPGRWSAILNLEGVKIQTKDYPSLSVDGEIEAGAGPLKMKKFSFSTVGLQAGLQGSVDPLAGILDLAVTDLSFQPADLKIKQKLPFDLPVSGNLSGGMKLQGTFASPKISGQLKVQDLAWNQGPLKDSALSGDLSLNEGTLQCPALVLTGPLGTLTFNGKMTDLFGKPVLESKLSAENVTVPTLLELAGMKGVKSTGQLNMKLELKGPFSGLTGEGNGEGQNVRLEFVSLETGKPFLILPFEALPLKVKLENGMLTSELSAGMFAGVIQLKLQLNTSKTGFPLTLNIDTPKLLDLQAFLALNPYARKALLGQAQAVATINGLATKPESFKGEGKIDFLQLVLDGEKLFGKLAPYVPNLAQEKFDRSDLAMTLNGRTMTIHDIHLQNKDMAVGGKMDVDLDSFQIKGVTDLRIFKAAVKQGSDIERAIPADGLKIDVPVSGSLFAPDLAVKLDMKALLKGAAESRLLDAVLKKVPGGDSSSGTDEASLKPKDRLKQELQKALLDKVLPGQKKPAPPAEVETTPASPATPGDGSAPAVEPTPAEPAPAEPQLTPKEALKQELENQVKGKLQNLFKKKK